MIVARSLTKHYRRTVAVDDLSFEVDPGVVTGFLGPERLGQVDHHAHDHGARQPDVGDGPRQRHALRRAAVAAARGRRPARRQGLPPRPQRLQPPPASWPGPTTSPDRRIDEVLDIVGLTSVAHQRAGRYSLGMGQRLGIASALLGDPGGPALRRAHQRARPRGHPLGPPPAARPRRRGPDGVRLQPPDQRDVPHGRAAGGDRPRHPDRRDERRASSPPRAPPTPCGW